MLSYCIKTADGRRTYCGATKNFDRRFRQHQGLIKGGAKATAPYAGQWCEFIQVHGFPTWNECLSFEWHWKHVAKYRRGQCPLARRVDNLKKLLEQPRWRSMGLVVTMADGSSWNDLVRA